MHLPDFPLQAALHVELPGEAAKGAPAILAGGESRRSLVLACNTAARGFRIDPGMTTARAFGRCPRVRVLLRNPSAEALAGRALLSKALDLSPMVEVSDPGTCTADLRGRVLEDGMLEGVLEAVRAALAKRGLDARAGAAQTPDLARWAARSASASSPVRIAAARERFLGSLSPETVGFPEALLEILRAWGIATMGAFAALPRQAVAERLGVEGARWWDAAHARGTRPLRIASLPEHYEESFEWEGAVESLEPLLFILPRLLEPLCERLRRRGMAARRVRLRLGLENRKAYAREFSLPEAVSDRETIFQMLYTHLEQVRTDHAMISVKLRLDPVPCAARQRGLFDAAVRNPRRLSETLARVTGAVGAGQAGSPRLEESYRPDAWTLEALPQELGLLEEEPVAQGEPPPAPGLPLRRLRPPEPARVSVRGGRPQTVASRSCRGAVRADRGPWSSSGDWWEKDRWERQEWDVQLACGRLCRLVREKGGWYVEGFYG